MQTIAYICLYVSSVPESVRFYHDALGLKPVSESEDPETSYFFAFETGSTVLALERNGSKKNGLKTKSENPFLLQLKANSIEELEAMNKRLEKHGVKLMDRSKETNYGTITNFCDPDGNKLEIIFQK